MDIIDKNIDKIIEVCKLGFGRILDRDLDPRVATENAFTIEVDKTVYIDEVITINEQTWINSFFADDKNLKTSNTAYNIHEYRKASLKFKLTPTPEFLKAAKEAIDSKDFDTIIRRFGQFISTEVILGGKAYFKKSNGNNYSNIKTVGGISGNFDKEWVSSLTKFENWRCIKFKNLISIYQFLPDVEQILKPGGCIHEKTEYLEKPWYLDDISKCYERQREIPPSILKHFDKPDYSILVTIISNVGKNEKDFFNCQIIWPDNKKPKLSIIIIREDPKKRRCDLRIKWMVIQYNKKNNNWFISRCNAPVYCFGIPVKKLENLNSSNNLPLIEHRFLKKKMAFSYCCLPSSAINGLIISNHSNSKISPQKRKSLVRIPGKPKYIIQLSRENNIENKTKIGHMLGNHMIII
ncbi:uncharacterized protein OCT59_019419 [Rhizophagus irregularis]|uniref:DUF7431 domain-containing protein n=3 Tax=Rhizophagus irregularis TaxID=588596 RepID=A0A015MKL7_RHIIW|nr:hypothetical protein GLOIN_2v1660076 [Rhizophagus irregularis DAOM 181602=DAOM 197198]EXX67393.1 hypothetical protein RirG_114810 [Rhizophagus irregularis DAOM 197198w]POG66071.1 hypothetical protein GLOIN_2v1660076 [Rhizophagus irregularis DAOM 181602=DAOM 197198]UZO27214.1 hypothetical protein OCT59_019419 [Rhizophagus irregularis]|eukprot:XP_025172937.1 hypothetical protein GLOIN_2v1660076 [Rhizophagus irregularis DAOM 181602=DAOM 197198]